MSNLTVADPASNAELFEQRDADQNDTTAHDSDDEPMVYTTPHDYASSARKERERLLAEGKDPNLVIFQSEVPSHVPRREGEAGADYAKRYCETMNDMIRRGVMILNDMTKANVTPNGFGTRGGRFFDLRSEPGATKGEYRRFLEWWNTTRESQGPIEVPEEWLRFERPQDESPAFKGRFQKRHESVDIDSSQE